MKSTLPRLTLLLATSALLTGWPLSARADWNVGDGHKMHYPQLPNPTGWDVNFTKLTLADDWRCVQTGPIYDVHLWFSWWKDYQAGIANVHLSIHSDVPDPDGPGGPLYSQPGAELWSRDFSFNELIVRLVGFGPQGYYDPSLPIFEPANHFGLYQLNIMGIAQPFVQEAGNIYWLDVRMDLAPGAPPTYAAGWKTSLEHFNDDAVWWDAALGQWKELRDPVTGESLDLAFVVVPEPSSAVLVLAGAGLYLLVALRRRQA